MRSAPLRGTKVLMPPSVEGIAAVLSGLSRATRARSTYCTYLRSSPLLPSAVQLNEHKVPWRAYKVHSKVPYTSPAAGVTPHSLTPRAFVVLPYCITPRLTTYGCGW